MPRLIWVFAGRTCHFVGFVTRRLISAPLKSDWPIKALHYESDTEMSRLMTKPTKWHVRPAKTQISLGIRPDWSETSLSAWRKLGSFATHWAHSQDSDQTGWLPRLIWVFAGHTVILLVLSWVAQMFLLKQNVCVAMKGTSFRHNFVSVNLSWSPTTIYFAVRSMG